MRQLTAFSAGLLFGIGLLVSGMTNPAKILNFLDIFGTWDPSLALVMAAAVPVAFLGFRLGRRMRQPVFARSFTMQTATALDARLLAGAALFGVGWGLGGFCPGPAIVALASGSAKVLIFVVAMLLAMAVARAGLNILYPAPRPPSPNLPKAEA